MMTDTKMKTATTPETKGKRGGAREGAGRPLRYGVHLERRELRLRPDVISGIKEMARQKSAEDGKRTTFAKYVDDVLFNHLKTFQIKDVKL